MDCQRFVILVLKCLARIAMAAFIGLDLNVTIVVPVPVPVPALVLVLVLERVVFFFQYRMHMYASTNKHAAPFFILALRLMLRL